MCHDTLKFIKADSAALVRITTLQNIFRGLLRDAVLQMLQERVQLREVDAAVAVLIREVEGLSEDPSLTTCFFPGRDGVGGGG